MKDDEMVGLPVPELELSLAGEFERFTKLLTFDTAAAFGLLSARSHVEFLVQRDALLFGRGYLAIDADGSLHRLDPETVMIRLPDRPRKEEAKP